MASDITLFSGYSQKENRPTNYCLLVLRMLYKENPMLLGEVLSNLVDAELADVVGGQFPDARVRIPGLNHPTQPLSNGTQKPETTTYSQPVLTIVRKRSSIR